MAVYAYQRQGSLAPEFDPSKLVMTYQSSPYRSNSLYA